jgi:hypothetical protein
MKRFRRQFTLLAALWLGLAALTGTTSTGAPAPTAADAQCAGSERYSCDGIPDIVCKAVCNQFQSAVVRDRCTYRQRLHVERYEKPKGDGMPPGKRKQNRDTEVIIAPASKPDETGQYLVETRVVADTDDDGKPKNKVDPKAITLLAAQGFLDLIFFPLTPERVAYYSFEDATSPRPGEIAYDFKPKSTTRTVPLAAGTVYLSPKTGEVLTLEISAIYNLEVIDKNLKNIESLTATVDYSQFNDAFRMPTLARGEGVSDVTRFKGYFKFNFEEANYKPALKMPSWVRLD